MEHYKKQIAYILAIFAFIFVISKMYTNIFSNTLKPRAGNISAYEALKRLSEEGEFYYDSYQNYGTFLANSDTEINSCARANTFLTTEISTAIIDRVANAEKKCYLSSMNGIIDAWMVALKDGDKIWCADSKGNTKKLSTWPTGYECE